MCAIDKNVLTALQ